MRFTISQAEARAIGPPGEKRVKDAVANWFGEYPPPVSARSKARKWARRGWWGCRLIVNRAARRPSLEWS